jgi:2-polyprenyl-3-methyl-5-hydroxy-6-metoxy-1,4-benzoquinol methylase
MAQEYHTLPNVTFECRKIEEMQGQFDCVLFMDVFHHVPPAYRDSILQAAARLVSPRGFVFIKDISRRGGFVSWMMDRYVSGYPANEIFLENLPDMAALVSKHLKVTTTHKRYRFPFPRYYVKAVKPAA